MIVSQTDGGVARRSLRRLCICGAIVLLGIFGPARGEDKLRDRVVLKTKGRSSRITLQCDIQEYTGKFIRVKTTAGTVRTYPASDVVDVRTPQTELHVKGLIAFTQHKYAAARDLFHRGLKEESRAWVRREILAMIVRCALRLGDHKTAADRFVLIVKSDPATPRFALIPLVWAPRTITADEQAQAKQWLLRSTDPATRLVAASLLLNHADWGRNAATALSGLVSSSDARVRDLAQAQLWRKRLMRGAPGPNELAIWERHARGMPAELRGGPFFLLGRAYLARKQNEKAAAAFLWLPLVYDGDHHLAARACLEAADALADVGRKSAASALYREVAVRFADTPFAAEAAAQRRSLLRPAGKR
ncbi:MAG: tol-pal system YbgF family protein [Planctomycetaceae bacterium]